MTSVFESYEQQFAAITADITVRIGRIPNLTGTDKKTAIGVVEGNIDEANELCEQMEVELHDVGPSTRPALKGRLDNYRKELTRLRKEFKQSQVALGGQGMRRELLGPEELYTSEDQRTHLLDSTARLEKTSDRLNEGYRITQETEEIGLEIMDNLQRDRETIDRMRGRLRDTDSDLSRGSRILRRISRRIIQHKIFFIVGTLVLIIIIALLITTVVLIKTQTGKKN
jgi:vesicle transport through interaction with t-SNAREs protein 1